MDNLPISFRTYKKEDFNYIVNSWSKHFQKVEPNNFIHPKMYFDFQNKIIINLINKASILVSYIDGEPDNIVGYIVYEQNNNDSIIIHYSVVKGIFRRIHVFSSLLEELQAKNKLIVFTHYFHLFKTLKTKFNLIYDPYRIL